MNLRNYAFGAVAAVAILNVAVRALLKLGGLPATLLIAVAVGLILRTVFQWRNQRLPEPREYWAIVGIYAAVLGLLYLGLLGMMHLKDEPGNVGHILFWLHYLCYPVLLAACLIPRQSANPQ
ncbi:hypothetical protein [Pseudomonas sp.]|uniref:hypothetical protein n=1 Tax=Pseudomonas sp. TaxID=306 RepID=UPI003A978D81